MPIYTVKTDGFEASRFSARNLDEAISEAFDGAGIGRITDQSSLLENFDKYVDDGGWCWIEQDGVRVIEIGNC